VYGDAIRTLTAEQFGDGILSAIDCKLGFEKKGERAVITIDAKFLPYKEF
jgi:cyanate lyase